MSNRKVFNVILLVLLIGLFSGACAKNSPATHRSISVVGKAVIFTPPDKITIAFSLNFRNKNLNLAKKKNNKTIKALNEVLKKFEVETKYISIQSIEIKLRYSYRDDAHKFLYYEISQSISISLTNLKDYEPFLSAILELGVDRINNVSFSVEDLKQFKNEARIKAVKNAEEKAKLLCSASENNGQKLKLGKVLQISENSKWNNFSYGMASQQNDEYRNMSSDSANSGVFSVSGKIQISAEVDMLYELED